MERAKLCNLGCLFLGNQGSTPKAISPLAPQSCVSFSGPQSSPASAPIPHWASSLGSLGLAFQIDIFSGS